MKVGRGNASKKEGQNNGQKFKNKKISKKNIRIINEDKTNSKRESDSKSKSRCRDKVEGGGI